MTRPRGLVKRIASVEDDSLVAALKKEWSAAKTSREQAERRLAELEGIERDLHADQAEVEALLEMLPRVNGTWSFIGYARFEGVLSGGLARGEVVVTQRLNGSLNPFFDRPAAPCGRSSRRAPPRSTGGRFVVAATSPRAINLGVVPLGPPTSPPIPPTLVAPRRGRVAPR